MKTKIEKLQDLSRKLIVELPIEQLDKRVDVELKKTSKNIKLDGFRTGKVPMAVLQEKYAPGIKQEEANKIVNETLYKAFSQEKISPAATPLLTNVDYSGDNLVYEVTFDIFPEFKLKKISSLKVEKNNSELKDKDVDGTIAKLQQNMAEYKEVDVAVDKSKLDIDFEGFLKGETFDGGSAKGHSLTIGTKTMIDGFEDGLIGAKKGEELTLKLKFPKEYQSEELAGKKCEFVVKVNKIEVAILPEVNEEFVKKYNEESLDSLRKNLKEHMQKELTDKLKHNNKDNAFTALLELHDFDIPQSSIKEEAELLLKDTEERMKQQNMPPSQGKLSVEVFSAEAAKRIKLGLIIAKVIKEHKLAVSDEAVKEHIEELSKSYPEEQRKQMLDWYNKDKNNLSGIHSLLLEKEVENLIYEKAKVKNITKEFDEVLG